MYTQKKKQREKERKKKPSKICKHVSFVCVYLVSIVFNWILLFSCDHVYREFILFFLERKKEEDRRRKEISFQKKLYLFCVLF
jgi:hypothetical protein